MGEIYKRVDNPCVEYRTRTFCWDRNDLKGHPFRGGHGFEQSKDYCQAEFYMDKNGLLVCLSDRCKKYLEEHNWKVVADKNEYLQFFATQEDIVNFANYVNEKQKIK